MNSTKNYNLFKIGLVIIAIMLFLSTIFDLNLSNMLYNPESLIAMFCSIGL